LKELQCISSCYSDARRAGHAAALATVVCVSGSTYRRPGARMLITEDGQLTGCVSGGCLERDVIERARRALRSGEPRLITYDSGSDLDPLAEDLDEDFGLGCNGSVRVLIEALDPGGLDHLAYVSACSQARCDAVLATVVEADAGLAVKIAQRVMMQPDGSVVSDIAHDSLRNEIAADAGALVGGASAVVRYACAQGHVAVFLERIEPPRPLVLFGAGHDAVPLVRLARGLGWHLTLVDERPSNIVRARSLGADAVVACSPHEIAARVPLTPRTAVVVMNHNYRADLEALRIVLSSPVRYVGVLGPRRRTEHLLTALRARGSQHDSHVSERLYGPVGLDIGADNPEEIALAIVAEIQAAFAGRCGGSSRDRRGPLHARGDIVSEAALRSAATCEVQCATSD